MSVCLNKPVDDVILSNALRAMLLKYPIHCMNFFRVNAASDSTLLLAEDRNANGKNFEARLVSEILYEDVVSKQYLERLDNDYFKTISKRKIPIDVDRATWKITVNELAETKKQYLTFATNHAFIDGKSGVHFMDDLLRELADAEEQQSLDFVRVLFSRVVDAPKCLPELSDNVVDLYQFSSCFALKKALQLLFLPEWVLNFYNINFVPGHPNLLKHPIFNIRPVSVDNECSFHKITLTPDETSSTLDFCRRNGFTLTPYIAACAFRALDETITPILQIDPSYDFNVVICGRRYYQEVRDKTRYGLYMSPDHQVISRNHTLLLAAKELSSKLMIALQNKNSFSFVGLLKIINIWDFINYQYEKKQTRSTFQVSNVGLVKISHGDWRVDDFIFSQGVGAAHFTISTCSTPQGGLNLIVSNHDSLDKIEDGQAVEKFIGSFKQKLVSHDKL